MSIHFFGLKGPFSDMKVGTQIYKHDFTEQVTILIISIILKSVKRICSSHRVQKAIIMFYLYLIAMNATDYCQIKALTSGEYIYIYLLFNVGTRV